MSLLQRLIKRLDLQQLETDVYVGGSGEGGVTENSRLFGGMVAAQATMAAQLSVDDFPLHSLHAYFLRPGRPNAEIVFDVTRAKEGKNFRARNVSAIQNNEIRVCAVSYALFKVCVVRYSFVFRVCDVGFGAFVLRVCDVRHAFVFMVCEVRYAFVFRVCDVHYSFVFSV